MQSEPVEKQTDDAAASSTPVPGIEAKRFRRLFFGTLVRSLACMVVLTLLNELTSRSMVISFLVCLPPIPILSTSLGLI